jgi:hypothetical protein
MPAHFSHFFCALPKEMAKVPGSAAENLANKAGILTFEIGNVEAWWAHLAFAAQTIFSGILSISVRKYRLDVGHAEDKSYWLG